MRRHIEDIHEEESLSHDPSNKAREASGMGTTRAKSNIQIHESRNSVREELPDVTKKYMHILS